MPPTGQFKYCIVKNWKIFKKMVTFFIKPYLYYSKVFEISLYTRAACEQKGYYLRKDGMVGIHLSILYGYGYI
jgi:hypothetical protein